MIKRFSITSQPRVGIAVVIVKDGKILFGKRKKTLGEGTYELPGGSLEMYETFEHCATREVFEETGITIKNLEMITVLNNKWPEYGEHFVTVVFGAEYDTGTVEVKEPDKCGGIDWYAILPEPLFETGEFFGSRKFKRFMRNRRWPFRVIAKLLESCKIY